VRIPEKTITVRLESEDGDAVFVFERMKANAYERFMEELSEFQKTSGEAATSTDVFRMTKAYQNGILACLLSVEGLENSDGSPVTVQQIQAKEVYQDVIAQILAAYQAALAPPEAEQKKEDSKADVLDESS
jgi:translation initiation factor 6 (eIF-6)